MYLFILHLFFQVVIITMSSKWRSANPYTFANFTGTQDISDPTKQFLHGNYRSKNLAGFNGSSFTRDKPKQAIARGLIPFSQIGSLRHGNPTGSALSNK